jgi:hypothetical protein
MTGKFQAVNETNTTAAMLGTGIKFENGIEALI